MQNKKTMGTALMAAGVFVLIVSLAADAIGIGDGVSFGYKQISGFIAGVIVAVAGFVLFSTKSAA